MAKRRNPTQSVRNLQATVTKLMKTKPGKTTAKFSKADERRIKAAIKNLDKNWDELKCLFHPWEFGNH